MADMEIVFVDKPHMIAIEVLGYMYHPDDLVKREQHLAMRWGQILCESNPIEDIALPPTVFRRLVSANSPETFAKEHAKETHSACMAGKALLYFIELIADPTSTPSMAKAKFLSQEHFRFRARDSKGNRGKSSEREIAKAWRKYQKVAHLWAGHLLTVEMLGHKAATEIMDREPLRFVALAEALLSAFKADFGEYEAWSAPPTVALPSIKLICSGLEKEDAEIIQTYTNKTKYTPS